MKSAILFFLLFSFSSFGQIRILDADSKEPIAFVKIHVIGTEKGVFSDAEGFFSLENLIAVGDSVVLSCVGYDSQVLSLVAVKKLETIFLVPSAQNVQEVQIVQRKQKFVRDQQGLSKKPKGRNGNDVLTGDHGTSMSVYIPNVYSAPGILKKVNLFISDVGYPGAPFRLHIYAVSELRIEPGVELTRSNILVENAKGKEWLTLDLTEERIQIPTNGCFIGIEWFDDPKAMAFSDTVSQKVRMYAHNAWVDTISHTIRHGHGVGIGARSTKYKNARGYLFRKLPFWNEWKDFYGLAVDESKFNVPQPWPVGGSYTVNENNSYVMLPCIYLEASYPKEKVETGFDEPKKRKLNRLERVKEDAFAYPQTSVSSLIASLVKAFENDDLIYVLKYLCVYKEDELEDLVDLFKENEDQNGVFVSTEEKEKALQTLRAIQADLHPDQLHEVNAHSYELRTSNGTYFLTVEEGKWKINPVNKEKLF